MQNESAPGSLMLLASYHEVQAFCIQSRGELTGHHSVRSSFIWYYIYIDLIVMSRCLILQKEKTAQAHTHRLNGDL